MEEVSQDCGRPYRWGHNNHRGFAFSNLGEQRRAIKDFNKAIELKPAMAATYLNRALVYHSLGEYQKALEDYDRVMAIDPENVEAYNLKGLVLKKIGGDVSARGPNANK